MKTRLNIASGEKVEHKGDLTIEQDIGAGAELKITNGSLTINGNIGHGAKIELIAPESKQRLSNNVIRMSGATSFGGVSIVNISGGFRNSVSANMMINNSYIGNVNINNRIFSDDQVTKLSGDSYKITSSRYTIPRSSFAKATIDGVEYKGSEIIVRGKEVWVDGTKPGLPITSSSSEPELPPAKLFFHYVSLACLNVPQFAN